MTKRASYTTATVAREPRGLIYGLTCSVSSVLLHGTKVVYDKDGLGDIAAPSIVLCSHPSFMDWYYMGRAFLPRRLSFVVARYYFFKKLVGNLLRGAGAFPKSMFMPDIEAVENIYRVIRRGGIVAMLPEARLSTVGRSEDIPVATAKLIRKLGVPVYAVQLNGAYLVKPKWGDGIRRGGTIEVNCKKLWGDGETKKLSEQEILAKIKQALRFNDFEWIKSRPDIRYRTKDMTRGLDNILYACPACGREFTLTAEGGEIACVCGAKATMDDRYSLHSDDFDFCDLQQWYDWQYERLAKEIENEAFSLRCKCELKLPSLDGKRMFRHDSFGECVLDRKGLLYTYQAGGGKTLFFPLKTIYALLFGAGENFETYYGNQYYYFAPENKKECVKWYCASMLLYKKYCEGEQ